LAWVVLFATIVMTVFTWLVTKNYADDSAEQDFLSIVDEANDAISQRMVDYTIALDSGLGLLRSSGEPVTRSAWKNFADALKLRSQFAGIQGLGYAVVVPPAEKDAFEQKVRAEGFPDFSIRPPGERDVYSAILYLEPFDNRNQRAFGFDMYSEPIRWEAMASAARTGVATVSGPVTLVQETDEDVQRGFLMYVPHYRSGAPLDTVEQRLNALVGWVYAPFRTGDLMQGVLPAQARKFFTEIYYSDNATDQNLLYRSSVAGDFESGRVAQNTIAIGDRLWTIRFTSDKAHSAGSPIPWIVVGAGSAIDLLLFIIVASLAFNRQRAEDIALKMTADLRTSNKSLKGFVQIVENAPSFIAIFEVGGGLHHLNRAWRSFVGLADQDPLPSTIEAVLDDRTLRQLWDVAAPAALQDGIWSGESTLTGVDGRKLEVSLTVLRHEGPRAPDESWLAVVAHDITAYRTIARLMALTEGLRRDLSAGDEPIRCIQAIGPDALEAVQADGLVARIGEDVFRLGDAPEQDAIDRQVREMGSTAKTLVQTTDCLATEMPELATPDRCAGAIVARLPGALDSYLAWFRGPATSAVDHDGGVESAESVHDRSQRWSDQDRNVADMVYRAVQSGMIDSVYRRLAFEATVDPLTGLGNRRALAITIGKETRASADVPRFSLLFIDLDRFKQLNDAFGHDTGDVGLQRTSARLKQVTSDLVGQAGRVFRLGGDEFVVLLRDVTPDQLAQLAEAIVTAFQDPLILRGSRHVLNVSIGAVVGAADGPIDTDELLRRGDLAMCSAKRAGGSRVAFYEDSFSSQAAQRLKLEQELYRALEDEQLIPAFQPITSLRSGRVVGAEALARWRTPTGDIRVPVEFIPLAEETGQIRQLDRQIANLAIARCAELLRDRSQEFHLSFNVSAKTFDAQYIDYLARLIDRYAIPPERLTIELTESVMVDESTRLKQLLIAVRAHGMKVAIDDFGTGYSSLAYLRDLPADIVKLDKTFIDQLHGQSGDDVVARWAIQLVADLGMTILAEGVETPTQEAMLLALGYDLVQGYRYGRPNLEPPVPGEFWDSPSDGHPPAVPNAATNGHRGEAVERA